ncbi:unnamed protein product [Lampetra planeri]
MWNCETLQQSRCDSGHRPEQQRPCTAGDDAMPHPRQAAAEGGDVGWEVMLVGSFRAPPPSAAKETSGSQRHAGTARAGNSRLCGMAASSS